MKKTATLLCFIVSMLPIAIDTVFAQTIPSHRGEKKSEDEEAVKTVVKQFLKAAGNYDVTTMRSMFLPNANIGWHSLKDGKWVPSSVSAEVWFESIAKRVNPKSYTEPVSNYTIHISEGRLAFVKADAILKIDDVSESRNMDFFVLMKDNGVWKFLSGSYTSVPIK